MQNTKNPLIFIIEDSVVYKDLIVGYLHSKGYNNLKTFKNGEECLKEISSEPDIIVLDYSFSGINGLDLMLKIREGSPLTNFVFLSGQNDVELAVKLMKMGADDYIVKNEKAPYNLVKSIEYIMSETKKAKVSKGFKIGVIGFFIVLFVIIMIIILMTIFLEDFNL